MALILCYNKKGRVKVNTFGRTSTLLPLLPAIGKCVSERLARDKNISKQESEDFVVEAIKDGMVEMDKENR